MPLPLLAGGGWEGVNARDNLRMTLAPWLIPPQPSPATEESPLFGTSKGGRKEVTRLRSNANRVRSSVPPASTIRSDRFNVCRTAAPAALAAVRR